MLYTKVQQQLFVSLMYWLTDILKGRLKNLRTRFVCSFSPLTTFRLPCILSVTSASSRKIIVVNFIKSTTILAAKMYGDTASCSNFCKQSFNDVKNSVQWTARKLFCHSTCGGITFTRGFYMKKNFADGNVVIAKRRVHCSWWCRWGWLFYGGVQEAHKTTEAID